MAELKINTQNIATVVVVIVAAFVMLGLYGRVSALEGRAATLEAQFDQLEHLNEEMTTLEQRVAATRMDIEELAGARDEILRAICDLLGRQPQQCGLVPGDTEPLHPPAGFPGPP